MARQLEPSTTLRLATGARAKRPAGLASLRAKASNHIPSVVWREFVDELNAFAEQLQRGLVKQIPPAMESGEVASVRVKGTTFLYANGHVIQVMAATVDDPAQEWRGLAPGPKKKKWLRTASAAAKKRFAERQNKAFEKRIDNAVADAFRQVVSLYDAEIKALSAKRPSGQKGALAARPKGMIHSTRVDSGSGCVRAVQLREPGRAIWRESSAGAIRAILNEALTVLIPASANLEGPRCQSYSLVKALNIALSASFPGD
jgi:hypothetical protein